MRHIRTWQYISAFLILFLFVGGILLLQYPDSPKKQDYYTNTNSLSSTPLSGEPNRDARDSTSPASTSDHSRVPEKKRLDTPKQSMSMYKNEAQGFSVAYPKDWVYIERRSTNTGSFSVGFFDKDYIKSLDPNLISYRSSKNYPRFYYSTTLPGFETIHIPEVSGTLQYADIEPEMTIMIEFYPEIKEGSKSDPNVIHFLAEKQPTVLISDQVFQAYLRGCYECYGNDENFLASDGIYLYNCNHDGYCMQIVGKRTQNYEVFNRFILTQILSTMEFFGSVD